jgi:hypothetical protein
MPSMTTAAAAWSLARLGLYLAAVMLSAAAHVNLQEPWRAETSESP